MRVLFMAIICAIQGRYCLGFTFTFDFGGNIKVGGPCPQFGDKCVYNAFCSEGKCVCKDLYQPSADGSTCKGTNGAQCSVSMDCANPLTCFLMTCSCGFNYRLDTTKNPPKCVKSIATIMGDPCDSNASCPWHISYTECINNHCRCQENYRFDYRKDDCVIIDKYWRSTSGKVSSLMLSVIGVLLVGLIGFLIWYFLRTRGREE